MSTEKKSEDEVALIRVAPSPGTGIFIRERRGRLKAETQRNGDTQKGKKRMTFNIRGETGVTQLQAKERQGLPVATRSWEEAGRSPQRQPGKNKRMNE